MSQRQKQRSGSAIVEMAACLPLIFTIVFGSIEACNMIALKQIISESAYDGALVALKPGSTDSEIVSSINTVLAARNVTPSSVTITGEAGAPFNSLDHGDKVIVTVEALTDGNVTGPQLFGFSRTVSGEASAIKQ